MPRDAPSPSERAFLRTICQTPYDIVPRLVFADWQEERDNLPFAHALRTECFPPPSPINGRWQGWPAEFLKQVRRWLGESFPLSRPVMFQPVGPGDLPTGSSFRIGAYLSHGCVEQLTCTLKFWERHGPGIVRMQPVVRVGISNRYPHPTSHRGTDCFWARRAIEAIHCLPPWLYDEIPHGRAPSRARVRHYPTVSAARDALSVAAVNYARKCAALDPIELLPPPDS